MEGLQRSAVSFRRQGSSGLIWDDNLLKAEIDLQEKRLEQQRKNQDNKDDDNGKSIEKNEEEGGGSVISAVSDELKPVKTGGSIERSRSNGGRGYRTGKVSPAIDPPSPKVSACGFCGGAFGNRNKESRGQRKPRSGKRKV